MRGSRKVCQGGGGGGGSTLIFLVDEGWKNLNTTISGPSSARQRNAIRCRADVGPILNAV